MSATRILAKVTPVKVSLEVLVASKHLNKLPEMSITSVKATLGELKESETSCKQTLKGKGDEGLSMADTNDLVKRAQAQKTLVQSMLTAIQGM